MEGLSRVVVRGSATVPAEPDQLRFTFTVTGLHPTPQEALRDVASRSTELESVLDDLEIDSTARSTTGVSVREEREYENGRYYHRGYSAANTVSIRLEDAENAGRLMREATEKAQARIGGPWWSIALDNPARVQAYGEAARDARRKARAYAEALEARLGAVVSITEPGAGSRRDLYEVHEFASPAAAEAAPEINVSAGDMEVGATVEVVFALEQ